MTAVDLLLVATLLAALLAWWIPALPGRRGLLALASTLALGAGLYAAWDDRWQAGVGAFAGFSLLLGACLRRKPVRGLPFRTGSLYGLLVLLAIAALYLFPVAPLPAPSGPYAVGVRDFELDDPSRPGLLGAPAGQPRRLLVRAWYPARPIAGAAPRHYFDPDEARSTARGFGEILGFPPLLAYLKHLRTNSYPDAPLRDDSARLPVVFYSHGYSAFAGGNWTLMEELASHGYAVYAIQHSGDASPTRLPDGTLLPMDPGWSNTCAGPPTTACRRPCARAMSATISTSASTASCTPPSTCPPRPTAPSTSARRYGWPTACSSMTACRPARSRTGSPTWWPPATSRTPARWACPSAARPPARSAWSTDAARRPSTSTAATSTSRPSTAISRHRC
ncbi:hypothetical protein ACNUI5_18450 [Pseudomonas aeruginosa]